ncbi:ATP-binding cassette domain-containing protein [Lactococcus hircilactis]|uniref:ATP-binding cassette domain-containing protein n=1 Tax=Lactococcus hircilactis TaxID=1494462 RepID=A0A7X1Z9S6_9LACT|nr:ABC transporter ATP-binding protein/permease [Lactococcus hircilactis]MQW39391.1 ATP-binding cassette domain-containing protein [Lactococcus hircilactis]
MTVLELKNIKKSYFLGKEEFPVLKGIDLDFERGDFVSLLGESGGGKSTLMNIIGGLDREYEGDVIVDGIVQRTKKEKAMDAYRRDTIGFIFQSFNLVSYLSVLDNIMISLKMTDLSEKERQKRALELTKQVGLYEHRKKKPSQLSGGQKQRVAIARALASDPEIILADEPTGALDSQNTKEVLALLRDIAQSGKTVIVVTHSQEVAEYGTRIIRLADGQIIGDERIKPAYPVIEHERVKSKALSFSDTFKTAFKHFTNAWKINLLIAIGTAIGLFSVIFFLGLGNGATKYMNHMITSNVNPNIITVFKRTTTDNKINNNEALRQSQQGIGQPANLLDQTHLDQLKDTKNVTKVEPTYDLSGLTTLKYKDQSKAGLFTITTYNASNINDDYVAGHKPSDGEIAIYQKEAKSLNSDYKAVIGETLTLTFSAKTAANSTVQVTKAFKVSGILKNPSTAGTGASDGTSVLVTYDTLKSALSSAGAATGATYAVVSVDKVDHVKTVATAIQELKINGTKAFATFNLGTILDTLTNITNIVSYVLAAIAGISLIVSIFMIVVTTYMSVAERTKEIGVIRALGGRRKDISRLFTFESLILGVASAVIAIVAAFIGEWGINSALSGFLDGASIVQISVGNIIFAVIIAVLIALFASLAPSGRAAKLNTIEALAAE